MYTIWIKDKKAQQTKGYPANTIDEAIDKGSYYPLSEIIGYVTINDEFGNRSDTVVINRQQFKILAERVKQKRFLTT